MFDQPARTKRELYGLILGLLLSATFFAFGLYQPQEVATDIGFVAPAIIGLMAQSRRLVVFFMVLGLVLIVLGSVLSQGDLVSQLAALNQTLAMLALVSVGGSCYLSLTEQSRLNAKLREAAETDELTGLYNRRVLMMQLATRLAEAGRYGVPLSLMLFDVDHFKQINDRYGHPVGDEVIKTIGKVCARTIRESDLLCRYGGEEFALLSPMTDREGAVTLAERIRETVAAQDYLEVDGQIVKATISVGVVSVDKGCLDEEVLLKKADDALYRAKRNGRNRVAMAPSNQSMPPLQVVVAEEAETTKMV